MEISEVAGPVKVVRAAKNEAKLQGVEMGGRSGRRLEGIIQNANLMAADLEDQHQHFIDGTYRGLEEYIQMPYDALKEAHSEGFGLFLRQQYRRFLNEDRKKIERLEDNAYVKDLAVGYTFDYLRTLTLSKKMGIPSKKALELASVSHWHNPNVLIHLASEYPEADASLIFDAVTDYPSRPEEFIKGRLIAIEDLQAEFPDVLIGIIKYAAVGHPSKPAEFIRDVVKIMPDLQELFSTLDPTIISYAVTRHHRDPQGFLEKYQERLEKLHKKYSAKNLEHAARNSDPENFLQNLELDDLDLEEE